jgi:hypothetical protein
MLWIGGLEGGAKTAIAATPIPVAGPAPTAQLGTAFVRDDLQVVKIVAADGS